jgi:hypothetical protein
MIQKVENEHGLCIDHQNKTTCVYANFSGRCKKPDYEQNCVDMVTGKSFIFIEVADE